MFQGNHHAMIADLYQHIFGAWRVEISVHGSKHAQSSVGLCCLLSYGNTVLLQPQWGRCRHFLWQIIANA
jgi:hypothetical protein